MYLKKLTWVHGLSPEGQLKVFGLLILYMKFHENLTSPNTFGKLENHVFIKVLVIPKASSKVILFWTFC